MAHVPELYMRLRCLMLPEENWFRVVRYLLVCTSKMFIARAIVSDRTAETHRLDHGYICSSTFFAVPPMSFEDGGTFRHARITYSYLWSLSYRDETFIILERYMCSGIIVFGTRRPWCGADRKGRTSDKMDSSG